MSLFSRARNWIANQLSVDDAEGQQPDGALHGEEQEAMGGGVRQVERPRDIYDIDPSTIKRYLLEAEDGDIASQAALYEIMEERDGTLDAHLRTRRNGVSSLEWNLQPADLGEEAESRDETRAEDALQLCKDVVSDITGLHGSIQDLLDAVPKGFSACEIDWDTGDDEWRVQRLVYRPQRWFAVGSDGHKLRLRQSHSTSAEINPWNWIIHRTQARPGFEYRSNLMRSLVRAFIVRHYSWKDWMAFSEVYGMPPRIGKLREGVDFDDPEAREMWEMLKHLGADAAAMVKGQNEIDVLDRGKVGEGEVYRAILKAAEREMTLAILGQTLTSGGEEGGSYALGQVHDRVRLDLVWSDALSLKRTLQEQLLKPIVYMNLGEDYPVPQWEWELSEPEDLNQTAEMLGKLVDKGMLGELPKSWIYSKFGIPEPTEDDEVVRPVPVKAVPASSAPTRGDGEDEEQENQAPFVIAAGDEPEGMMTFADAAEMHHMTPDEFNTMLNQPLMDIGEKGMEYLEAKKVADAQAWEQLSSAGKSKAWWVTGLGQDATRVAASHLLESYAAGETMQGYVDRLQREGLAVPMSEEPGPGQIPKWQAKLVRKNNSWTARNAAQWRESRELMDVRPYGQWKTYDPCSICQPLSGHTAPLDGSFFNTYWPQLHHGCRCEVLTVSQRDMEDEGLDVSDTLIHPNEPDPQFLAPPAEQFRLPDEPAVTDAGRQDDEILSGLPGL